MHFCAVLNFFPLLKIDFWPFLKLQKMEFGQKFFSWNWIIWFHEFFGPGLFSIVWPTATVVLLARKKVIYCIKKRLQINFSRQNPSVENSFILLLLHILKINIFSTIFSRILCLLKLYHLPKMDFFRKHLLITIQNFDFEFLHPMHLESFVEYLKSTQTFSYRRYVQNQW